MIGDLRPINNLNQYCGDQKPQKKRRVIRKALRVGTNFKFQKNENN
jgi:hypothetical protein